MDDHACALISLAAVRSSTLTGSRISKKSPGIDGGGGRSPRRRQLLLPAKDRGGHPERQLMGDVPPDQQGRSDWQFPSDPAIGNIIGRARGLGPSGHPFRTHLCSQLTRPAPLPHRECGRPPGYARSSCASILGLQRSPRSMDGRGGPCRRRCRFALRLGGD